MAEAKPALSRPRHNFHVAREVHEDGTWTSWCGVEAAADRKPLGKWVVLRASTLADVSIPCCPRCFKALEEA